MRIYPGYHGNTDALFMENETLRLGILPERGGKIATLVYKPRDFEVFAQPAGNNYAAYVYGMPFEQGDSSGADEMFPTIEACAYPAEGYSDAVCPDHGELWTMVWDFLRSSSEVVGIARGVALPYVFERRITMWKNEVMLNYWLENRGDFPLYGLWAFHGLTACDEQSRIILPGVKQVMETHNSERNQEEPEMVDFPGGDRDRITSPEARRTRKYYISSGRSVKEAGITLNGGSLLYRLLFEPTETPCLGVWINEGGYKSEYNTALEPSNGYYDSLERAYRNGTLRPVMPGERRKWSLTLELSEIQE